MNKGGKVMTDGKRSEAGSGQGGEVVLITGASGFIAAALIAQLGERYTVVGLDRAVAHPMQHSGDLRVAPRHCRLRGLEGLRRLPVPHTQPPVPGWNFVAQAHEGILDVSVP